LIRLLGRLAGFSAVWFGLVAVLYILSLSQIGWCRNAKELIATDGACNVPPDWFWVAIFLPYLLICAIIVRRARRSSN